MRTGAPEIVAHRGGPLRRGVARHAENTLPAFAETWARERSMPWPFTPDAVDEAHERGLAVMAYTVNDADGVRAAACAGVDAVITDDPCAARLALAAEAVGQPVIAARPAPAGMSFF